MGEGERKSEVEDRDIHLPPCLMPTDCCSTCLLPWRLDAKVNPSHNAQACLGTLDQEKRRRVWARV